MKHLMRVFTSGLLILVLYLVIILTILAISEMGPAQADVDNLSQPVVTTAGDDIEYLRLTDAPPARDITKQRFAPLETSQ